MKPAWRRAVTGCALLLAAGVVVAVPPPRARSTTDCQAPEYASDRQVCEDTELRELDRALAQATVDPERRPTVHESDEDWFRRSRLCAFESTQRECLIEAYCARLGQISCSRVQLPAACAPSPDVYIDSASISRAGFARRGSDLAKAQGEVVRLWGYVDYRNLYGDDSAREVLGEWWSGYGPGGGTWRFDLKAKADDGPGESFAVHLPNDCGRDEVLRVFRSGAETGHATRVYLEGRLYTFDAPTAMERLTGLRLELDGAHAIAFAPPVDD